MQQYLLLLEHDGSQDPIFVTLLIYTMFPYVA